MKLYYIIGSLLSFTGIIASSLSSHTIKEKLISNTSYDSFILAQNLLIIHGLAVILFSFLGNYYKINLIHYANIGIITGILLFSGTIFIKSLVPPFTLGFLTPVGGAVLMMSWLLIVISFFRIKV